MRRIALILLLTAPSGIAAEEWTQLSGAEIKAALTDAKLQYATATQTFYASGKTLYDAGRPSWGYWRVQGDQYCSQWPPSDLWACYDMAARGHELRFIGASGDVTDGTVQ